MAEFVQQRLEERLTELEQLERVGLFNKAEIKAIVKRVRGHEYKLARKSKEKEDFLRYIQYEINLLSLVTKRRKRIGYFFKKEEIEYSIVQRVINLFKRACSHYNDDIKLWMSYIQFCKKWNRRAALSKIFAKLVKIHSNVVGLWIMAAKFEMEDHNSPDSARGLLLRALRFHPESRKLWAEYFRLELMNADKLRKRWHILQDVKSVETSIVEDELMQGKAAIVVYKKAIQSMPDDIEFRFSLLPISREFDFTQDVQNEIYNDLKKDHPENELTWNALARRHLVHEEKVIADARHREMDPDLAVLQMEQKCYGVFDKAVKKLPTRKMWTLYAETCLERIREGQSEHLCNQHVLRAIKLLSSIKYQLSEELYEQWVDVLIKVGMVDKAKEVAEIATKSHIKSVKLWLQRLQLVINDCKLGDNSGTGEVMDLFDYAASHVKSKQSQPLWDLGLTWCLACNPDEVEAVFQHGITQHKQVALLMKEKYLEWAAFSGGTMKCQEIYKRLIASKPIGLNFYMKYISIECGKAKPKIIKLRKCYEAAIQEFGASNTDLWLSYVKLELTHPKGKKEKVGDLYWRALKHLNPSFVDDFISQYTLFQTGHLDV
ncbi:U3 small nucleolar RNA-associated protein 6 homolog [Saccoglossus kowalevskii]|uniref:U3 small nucleolar RNA-associated protein 6 homolog n=1 Tax=Saccoglossus kowalevskii TaxID=10224 RepID=A0ABM0GYR1_SACKO|nr:PREDICTED: U3 small nucleolar RNA-associated protein 6 homolog [Saccoglossus kowalevskii]